MRKNALSLCMIFILLQGLCTVASAEDTATEEWHIIDIEDMFGTDYYEWRKQYPNNLLAVDGDFNGDGKRDRAELSLDRSEENHALVVYFSHDTPDVKIEIIGKSPYSDIRSIYYIGIELAAAGNHKTICGYDPDYCEDENDPKFITLENDAIHHLFFDKGSEILYYRGDKFESILTGD